MYKILKFSNYFTVYKRYLKLFWVPCSSSKRPYKYNIAETHNEVLDILESPICNDNIFQIRQSYHYHNDIETANDVISINNSNEFKDKFAEYLL